MNRGIGKTVGEGRGVGGQLGQSILVRPHCCASYGHTCDSPGETTALDPLLFVILIPIEAVA